MSDLPLEDRSWVIGGPQRQTARTECTPREHVPLGGVKCKPDNSHRQRQIEITFHKKIAKSKSRSRRILYTKKIRQATKYRRSTEENISDIIEKSKQHRFREDLGILNRRTGIKRNREYVAEEDRIIRTQSRTKKIQKIKEEKNNSRRARSNVLNNSERTVPNIRAGARKIPERTGVKVKVTDQAPDIPECKQSIAKPDTPQTQPAGDYLASNYGGKVGVKNKWGLIKQLKSGADNDGGKFRDSKQALAKGISRKGKVYKPGEIPKGQLLISRFLKSKGSRPSINNPEEE